MRTSSIRSWILASAAEVGVLCILLTLPGNSEAMAESELRRLLDDFFGGGVAAEASVDWEVLTLPGFEWAPCFYKAMTDAQRGEWRARLLESINKAPASFGKGRFLDVTFGEEAAGLESATFPSPYDPTRILKFKFRQGEDGSWKIVSISGRSQSSEAPVPSTVQDQDVLTDKASLNEYWVRNVGMGRGSFKALQKVMSLEKARFDYYTSSPERSPEIEKSLFAGYQEAYTLALTDDDYVGSSVILVLQGAIKLTYSGQPEGTLMALRQALIANLEHPDPFVELNLRSLHARALLTFGQDMLSLQEFLKVVDLLDTYFPKAKAQRTDNLLLAGETASKIDDRKLLGAIMAKLKPEVADARHIQQEQLQRYHLLQARQISNHFCCTSFLLHVKSQPASLGIIGV